MSFRTITDAQEWNEAVLALPTNHVLQSWEWGEVKARHGWNPTRLLWEEDAPVAAAQVLQRLLPYTPWSVMYVPKGPALDYTRKDLVERVLSDLETHACRRHAIFVKIDPDVDLSSATQRLEQHGWRYSDEQIQFRNTALLDLRPSEEDLLAEMKSKTRYNIRLAGRKGVTVRPGGPEDYRRFHTMYAETGRRDGFLTRPFEYYQDAWRTFLGAELGHMLLAEVEDEIVAGLILFRFGPKAWYMYGASISRHREKMPNYALQWEAIRWAQAHGCAVYDLWGAPDTLDDSDPLWSVWRFKEGFGAKFTPHIGAYDYPASRPLYWAYKIALPRYLNWLRSRGWKWLRVPRRASI